MGGFRVKRKERRGSTTVPSGVQVQRKREGRRNGASLFSFSFFWLALSNQKLYYKMKVLK
jgi:hypothetical protein